LLQRERMNARIYFPEKYQNKIYAKVGDLMDSGLECFNSAGKLHWESWIVASH
jgi:hypothetical protein